MLLRDVEEEKTVKGLKISANKNKERYIVTETENEYLKEEIEKLTLELDKKKKEHNEDEDNRQLLGELFDRGIIDENGNIL